VSERALRDRRGRLVELGALLGAGGEGSVLAVRGRPGLCAKIYLPDRAAARADKIRAMVESPPPWLLRRAMAWPVEPLYTDDARAAFAGFLMPARRGMVELYRILVPDERMAIAGWLTQRDLCLVAAAVARIVAGLHRAGHCVGDLKPQNVLVAPLHGRVALVDADSFQVRDRATGRVHRSAVITPEYTAPELCSDDPARTPRTPASDAFALAVLVHQILLGGAHPFEGEPAPGRGAPLADRVPDRIRRGLCPLVPTVTAVRAPAGAVPSSTLHPALREMFVRCFGEGHGAPDARPGAAAWEDALRRAARDMVRCPASQAHLHDRALAACPWCARRARTGIDLYPAKQGWQRVLARSPDPAAAPEPERLRWLSLHVRGRTREGAPTAAERAWLEKAGAALGFDRARVAQAITLASGPRETPLLLARLRRLASACLRARPRLPDLLSARLRPRRMLLLSAATLASVGISAAAVSVTSKLLASTRASAAWPRSTDDGAPASESEGEGPPTRPCVLLVDRAVIGNTRGQGAFLRISPSTSSEKLPLPDGTEVRITGRARAADRLEWSEVEVPPLQRTGWVATKYLVAPR
jgi:hypothetical protein